MSLNPRDTEIEELLERLQRLADVEAPLTTGLAQLDASLSSLSSAIALVSSAFNVPDGIHCNLVPIAPLAGPLTGGVCGYLFKLELLNATNLALSGRWSLTIASLSQGNTKESLVHSVPILDIPAGQVWSTTFSLDIQNTCSIPVGVFLSYLHPKDSQGSQETMEQPPSISLLHIYRIDCLSLLQGEDMQLRAFGKRPTLPATQRCLIKVALPKPVFGLHPSPEDALEALLGSNGCSIPSKLPDLCKLRPLDAVILPSDMKQRKKPSQIHGMVGQGKNAASVAISASVPGTSLAANTVIKDGASKHCLVELACAGSSFPVALRSHTAVLRRVLDLQPAVTLADKTLGGGVKLPTGVLLHSRSSSTAYIDPKALKDVAAKLQLLKEQGQNLQALAIETAGMPEEEGHVAAELEKIMRELRQVTAMISMRL